MRSLAVRLGFLAATVVSVVGVVGSATAAPSTKKFEAYVTPGDAASTSFILTLANDSKSNQTLGSANFTPPAGWTLTGVSANSVTSTDNHMFNICLGSGGSTCGDGTAAVEFRAATSQDFIGPGQSVSATITATHAGCADANWTATAKQSNTFLGTNNWFSLVGFDLNPLGSFSFSPNPVPAQLTNHAFDVSFTAYDTCGKQKTNYSGANPPYNGTPLTHTGLSDASDTISGLSWSGGVGTTTVNAAVAETGNSLTVTDKTSSITTSTNSFDILDVLCTSGSCHAQDNKNNPSTTLDSPAPPVGKSLGLGFNRFATFNCGGVTSYDGSLVIIDPFGYTTTYQVTITYSKAASGTGPASGFVVCLTKDNGQTWKPAPDCASSTDHGCVLSRKRTSGGGLQIVLQLAPGDPGGGTYG